MAKTKGEVVQSLKAYFQDKGADYGIDMGFLYGSWARGYPKENSDVDVAVVFNQEMGEEEAFEVVTTISLELTGMLKSETNILAIDADFTRPMLYYNAIILGIPVYVSDFTRCADLRMQAIHQMEDFSIFGIPWQREVVRKRMEALTRA